MRPSSAELSPGGWGGVGRADWRPGRTMKRFTEKRVVSREDWKPGRRGERGRADEEQGGGGRGSRQARWRRSRRGERRRRRAGEGEDAVFQPPRTSRHGPPEPHLPGPAFPPRPAQPSPVGWRMGRPGRTRSLAGLSDTFFFGSTRSSAWPSPAGCAGAAPSRLGRGQGERYWPVPGGRGEPLARGRRGSAKGPLFRASTWASRIGCALPGGRGAWGWGSVLTAWAMEYRDFRTCEGEAGKGG